MPLPDHTVRDPRVKRTRRLLQDSLRTLLRQKPLDDILVQDVTDAAEVNRATFYDHYNDKLDLFNALIGADFQKLLEARKVALDGTCSGGLGGIVLAVGDYLQLIRREQAACTRPGSSEPLIDEAVTLAVRRIILEGLEKRGSQFPVSLKVQASMVSGAIYCAVKESLSEANWSVDEPALLALVPAILPLLGHKGGTEK